MKLRRDIFSFRNRVVVIVVGVVLGGLSLLYTNNMAQRLKEKEQHDVALWAHAMERVNREVLSGTIQTQDPLVEDLISNNNNIPFIITNQDLEVVNYSHLIPEEVIDHPDRLRRQIEKFTEENTPRTVRFWWTDSYYYIIFYGKSALLKSLYYFPYIQLLVIAAFITLGFIAFRSSKHDEQNRVWIGLAKETAHQLGTPTSSLLGWLEYLRAQDIDQSAVDEMQKDLAHLMKIDAEGPRPPDEDRRPLLEDRLRDTAHSGQHQRGGRRVGHVLPQAHPAQRHARLQRTGHRPGAGQHQLGPLRVGRGEPHEELTRRPAGARHDRREDLVG